MIRKLEKKDEIRFMQLIDDFYHSEAVLHTVNTKNYKITFDLCIQDDPFVACYVFEQDNIIKGYVLLSFSYSNEVGGMVVWIEELYIDEKYRGNKIGTQLMAFVHSKYKDSSKRFRLEATHSNTGAIKLYESMDYEILDYLQMTKDI